VTPEQAADALLSKAVKALGDDLPVDVDEIAFEIERLEVRERANLADLPGLDPRPSGAVSGLLLPAERQIWVEATEAARSSGRRRFTIAHELGHWALHRPGKASGRRTILCRPADVGAEHLELKSGARLEREANRFAATLLMPEAAVRREAEAVHMSIPVLAKRFDVSARAIQIRLQVLNLIPEYMQ
jgi:hypothetical protein